MMTKTASLISIAVVGAGRVAQHYKAILDSGVVSGYRMVGVFDVVAEKSDQLASHWNCPAYSSLEEMLISAKPDLVLVLTPSGLHYEHAKTALLAGCHVLVEKPMSLLLNHASDLNAIADIKQRMLCVAFQNRFNPAIQALKRALDASRFGKILTASVRLRWCRYQSYYEDEWHGTWAQDGGVISQQAIHHIDALNWLIGPVHSVSASMGNLMNELEAEDTLVAAVRFDSGAFGTVEATTAVRPDDFEASLSVIGENGKAVIGGIALNKVEAWDFVESQPSDEFISQEASVEVPNGYGLSHGPLLQEILNRIASGQTEAPVSGADGEATLQLIHALYKSVEDGRWTSLNDRPSHSKLGIT